MHTQAAFKVRNVHVKGADANVSVLVVVRYI